MAKYRLPLFMLGLLFFSSNPSMGQSIENSEDQFLQIPNPDSCRRNLFILTQQPHIAGSPEDSNLAVFVNDRFKEYGINSQIVTYYVYLPYPKSEEDSR